MVFFEDENMYPPPPPRYKAKSVKDKSLKDEVLYRTEFYIPTIKRWNAICLVSSKKAAKINKKKSQKRYNRNGLKLKYRIVKLIIKKEVVK